MSQTESIATERSAASRLKVFVSYSRKDATFADELASGLELCGFEAYLDKEDIAPGEPWEQRLGRLICDADTVVFALSPDAVASKHCEWEVAETVRLSKRLLPVVWRVVPEQEVPDPLKRLNYIFFTDGHSFTRSLGELATALRTDLDWIRQHTRFGDLAQNWEIGGSRRAFSCRRARTSRGRAGRPLRADHRRRGGARDARARRGRGRGAGTLTGWVNNAGIEIGAGARAPRRRPRADARRQPAGTAYGCAVAVHRFLARGTPARSSTSARSRPSRAFPRSFAYQASKGGVDALTRQVAVEYGAAGIRCNAVRPGAIDTPLCGRTAVRGRRPGGGVEAYADLHPLGRIGRADEVAAVIAFLLGPDASFVTGACVAVDGGAAARCYPYPPSPGALGDGGRSEDGRQAGGAGAAPRRRARGGRLEVDGLADPERLGPDLGPPGDARAGARDRQAPRLPAARGGARAAARRDRLDRARDPEPRHAHLRAHRPRRVPPRARTRLRRAPRRGHRRGRDERGVRPARPRRAHRRPDRGLGAPRPPAVSLGQAARDPARLRQPRGRGSRRSVVMDDERASAVALDHLVELGHERVGHIGGPADARPGPAARGRLPQAWPRSSGSARCPVVEGEFDGERRVAGGAGSSSAAIPGSPPSTSARWRRPWACSTQPPSSSSACPRISR